MTPEQPQQQVANPGSREAQEAGCRCPVLDNAHGRGHGIVEIDGVPTPVFVMHGDCSLHGRAVGYDWRNR